MNIANSPLMIRRIRRIQALARELVELAPEITEEDRKWLHMHIRGMEQDADYVCMMKEFLRIAESLGADRKICIVCKERIPNDRMYILTKHGRMHHGCAEEWLGESMHENSEEDAEDHG